MGLLHTVRDSEWGMELRGCLEVRVEKAKRRAKFVNDRLGLPYDRQRGQLFICGTLLRVMHGYCMRTLKGNKELT